MHETDVPILVARAESDSCSYIQKNDCDPISGEMFTYTSPADVVATSLSICSKRSGLGRIARGHRVCMIGPERIKHSEGK